MKVQVRRVYDEPEDSDGARVLVDRVWPRGVRKADARLNAWVTDVAPSTSLRKWYGHDPDKFGEFAEYYREELDSDAGRAALEQVRDAVSGSTLTLLTAARDVDHSQARVLADLLD